MDRVQHSFTFHLSDRSSSSPKERLSLKDVLLKCPFTTADCNKLVLQRKGITCIDQVPECFRMLEHLDLTENCISSIAGIEGFTQLRTLKLRKNALVDLPCLEPLSRLRHLQVLELSENPVSRLATYHDVVVALVPTLTCLDGIQYRSQLLSGVDQKLRSAESMSSPLKAVRKRDAQSRVLHYALFCRNRNVLLKVFLLWKSEWRHKVSSQLPRFSSDTKITPHPALEMPVSQRASEKRFSTYHKIEDKPFFEVKSRLHHLATRRENEIMARQLIEDIHQKLSSLEAVYRLRRY